MSVADLEFWKGGFLYAIKARVACLLGVAIPEDWPFWKKQLVLQKNFV